MTNIKIPILKETYPEDKLNEDDQTYFLEELGKVLCRTPIGELPHRKSYRLEGGTLIYRCADQQSSQWLVKAIDNHRLGTGAKLKVTGARNLPKPVKVALRTRDKVIQTQDELLTWIKNLNPGLNIEHWKVLDRHCEPKGQRLLLHKDRGSLAAIKSTGYKIFTGLSQGTVKVMKEPEAQKENVVLDTASSKSVSEEEGGDTKKPRNRICVGYTELDMPSILVDQFVKHSLSSTNRRQSLGNVSILQGVFLRCFHPISSRVLVVTGYRFRHDQYFHQGEQ
jgi:hypothetical protein